MSKELSFEGADYYRLFDLLIDAAGKEWSESPSIMLDGKRRSLHSAAAIISKELGYQGDLLGRHQEKVDSQFSKEQRGYGRTAYNLVNRAHENASASMHRLAVVVASRDGRAAGQRAGSSPSPVNASADAPRP